MQDRKPSYQVAPTFWGNSELDKLVAEVFREEFKRVQSLRAASKGTGDGEGRVPSVGLESIRTEVEARTGLSGLTAIDQSIFRTIHFDNEIGGFTKLTPEMEDKLQKQNKPTET